ncbi:MAG TPA: thioredoxin family protein [Armatimonadota bacterium]|nr:thioredoxin family protein [Armatimonadota bacterium]
MCIGAFGCGKPASTPQNLTQTGGAVEGEAAPVERGEIAWSYDFEAGLAAAKEANKPVMVDVFATWCAPCKMLDENVFSRADVAEASKSFVTIRVDGDKYPEIRQQLNVNSYPTVLFLTPEGREMNRSMGSVSYDIMLEAMGKAQEQFAEGQ